MSSVLTTIHKAIMGDKRIHYGTATLVDNATSSEIATGLRTLESFDIAQMFAYTFADGVVTFKHLDAGASCGIVGWVAIGY
jgi:hypothetical protein